MASRREIERLAQEAFGIEELRPGQLQAIEAVTAGLVEPEADAERPFEIGATVTHSEWGPGEVQRYEGDRVIVLFESVGYRILDLELVEEKGLLEAAG